ncbi:hypothetical protein Vafri_5740, partial [Volvox africanus]
LVTATRHINSGVADGSQTLGWMSSRRILRAIRDCCLGYPRVSATATAATPVVPPDIVMLKGEMKGMMGSSDHSVDMPPLTKSGSSNEMLSFTSYAYGHMAPAATGAISKDATRRNPEAMYGLYYARQALALDGYTLAYICAKTVVYLVIPFIAYGIIDRQELLLTGPHLLLRILAFAPKAILLFSAALDRCKVLLLRKNLHARGSANTLDAAAPGASATPSNVLPPSRRASPQHLSSNRDPRWAVAWREA